MNVNHYTPIHFKKSVHLSQLFSLQFEPLLLSLLVLTGFVGSIYLFGQNMSRNEISSASGMNNNRNNAAAASTFFFTDDESKNDDFDDYIKIKTESKVKAGETFYFDFLKDHKASRYVMEMGDGVRLIVTQSNLQYQYAEPGKYVIELKEIKGGLLNLIGTKKLKAK